MEVSKGFTNFEKKNNRTHVTATTLIPRRNIVQEIYRNGKEIREMEGIGIGSLTLEEQ